MIRSICLWLAKHLPSFTIPDNNGDPYLTRYYFFGKDRWFGNIYLHHFHRSDMDVGVNGYGLLHNHPWWGLSFILLGGYEEERRVSKTWYYTLRRTVKPFTFNFLSTKDFHRVDLLEKDAWSIFITGPRSKKRSWGFWDRITNEYRDFTTKPTAIP
jgi:hypothetical protein